MPEIFSRTVAAEISKRVVLSNSQIARKLAIGNNWNSIRIGIRWGWAGSSALAVTGTPRFFLGMCNGTERCVGDLTTDCFIGIGTDNASWTYITTPVPSHQWYSTSAVGLYKKLGTSITKVSSSTASVTGYARSNDSRYAMALTLDRTASRVSWVFSDYTNSAVRNVSVAQFKAGIEGDAAVLWGSSGIGFNNTAITLPELTSQVLDTVNISWDRTQMNIEIDDVYVMRMS